MKTVLIISSFVAASHVGANVSNFCLRRLGHNTVVLPTTLFGRHPGWGTPGGHTLPAQNMQSMWEAIKANAIHFDAVLTGYLADPEQVQLAEKIIKDIRQHNPHVQILIDPVMGDQGRLYIAKPVVHAIRTTLVPLAHLLTPNLSELGFLTQSKPISLPDILTACRSLSQDVIVTSVKVDKEIGALYYSHTHNHDTAYLIRHPQFQSVPHGGGDAVSSLILGHKLNRARTRTAFKRSISSIFSILEQAIETDAKELPLIECQADLTRPPALSMEIIS